MSIVLLQHGSGDQAPLMRLVAPAHQAICDANGYRYTYDAETTGQNTHHPSEWVRFPLVYRALLAGAKLVWWLDADAVIRKRNIDLSWPMRTREEYGICFDGNCGVFWIKNTPRALELMRELAESDDAWQMGMMARYRQMPTAPRYAPYHPAPLDKLLALYPEERGLSVCRFDSTWNEWNHWHRPVESVPEGEIEAFHGVKPANAKTWCAARVMKPAPFNGVGVVQHGSGAGERGSFLMVMANQPHRVLSYVHGFKYWPDIHTKTYDSQGRANAWARFELLLKHWYDAEVLWWLDNDALMVAPDIDLTWPMRIDADFGMDSKRNCGVFWIKPRSAGARALIESFANTTNDEKLVIIRNAERMVAQRGRCGLAIGPLDNTLYERSLKFCKPHFFGGEWNHWRRGADVNGRVYIKAFHGEQNRGEKMRALWKAVLRNLPTYEAQP